MRKKIGRVTVAHDEISKMDDKMSKNGWDIVIKMTESLYHVMKSKKWLNHREKKIGWVTVAHDRILKMADKILKTMRYWWKTADLL
jgi:hypothetical protein